MAVTMLQDLINPQVMADMISAELENKLRATKFFKTNRTLTGRAGDTITVPAWKYIGAAADLPENERGEVTQMETQDISYTVKKAVKNVSLTDESVLSGYGDPVGEATRQLRMSIQDKMDDDAIELLKGITADNGHVHNITGAITYNDIIDALYLMEQFREEQGIPAWLMVSPATAKDIRKSPEFIDNPTALRDRTISNGTIEQFAGCIIIISGKLSDNEAYILTPNCFTAFMKRDISVESEREMLYKRTLIGSDCHYVVAVEDYDKLVAIRWAA